MFLLMPSRRVNIQNDNVCNVKAILPLPNHELMNAKFRNMILLLAQTVANNEITKSLFLLMQNGGLDVARV